VSHVSHRQTTVRRSTVAVFSSCRALPSSVATIFDFQKNLAGRRASTPSPVCVVARYYYRSRASSTDMLSLSLTGYVLEVARERKKQHITHHPSIPAVAKAKGSAWHDTFSARVETRIFRNHLSLEKNENDKKGGV
jgi:hypothetical protein